MRLKTGGPPLLRRARDAAGLRELRRRRGDIRRREVTPGTPALIVGALSAASGIAEGARLMLADLRRHGVEAQALDATRALRMPAALPERAALRPGDALPALPRILHFNPPHFGRALHRLGAAAFTAPVVAYWAWELERAPAAWLASAALADEVWVPSPFVGEAVAALIADLAEPPRLRVVPHPIAAAVPQTRTPEARSSARRRLGLNESAFVAGFSFSMRAGLRRKNPQGAIAAFRAAFPGGSEPAALLLRCVDPEFRPAAWKSLCDEAGTDSRIRPLGKRECSIAEFYAALDTLLSLHRSEGYGLTLAEALAAGIPVVGTAWSLPNEIVGHPLFRAVPSTLVPVRDPGGPYAEFGSLNWAEPDAEATARHLRELADRASAGGPA